MQIYVCRRIEALRLCTKEPTPGVVGSGVSNVATGASGPSTKAAAGFSARPLGVNSEPVVEWVLGFDRGQDNERTQVGAAAGAAGAVGPFF